MYLLSKSTVSKPSSEVNWLSTPSVINIKKKSTAQNGDPGNNVMASVNTTNANPGPLATCNGEWNIWKLLYCTVLRPPYYCSMLKGYYNCIWL